MVVRWSVVVWSGCSAVFIVTAIVVGRTVAWHEEFVAFRTDFHYMQVFSVAVAAVTVADYRGSYDKEDNK
jgi:hypothetical protein